MTPPVDTERLRELSDGSATGMRMTIDIFLEDTRDTLAELAVAVRGPDQDAVRLLAHRAGGSSAACGAVRLAALLWRLESASPLTAAEAESLARQVAREFEDVERFLETYMAGLQQ
jgi:HPt (histidine-containing phosphotransfer) domain-containing protein